MSKVIKLRKGLNIRIIGDSKKEIVDLPMPNTVALKPTDFHGLTPKLKVKEGHVVKKGDPLFYDKYKPEVFFTAPVGGKVVTINRGERRKVLEVVIETNEQAEAVEFKKGNPDSFSEEEIKETLLKSGLWPFIKRRPYGLIASPNEKPRSIFISTFDTSPLAPDYDYIIKEEMDTFQIGIDVLNKLTEGKVYLGVKKNSIFSVVKNVEINQFQGEHPAGLVGVQIHHVHPIMKGDVVWTINPQEVLFIGRLFEKGQLDVSKVVALAGSEIEEPKYYRTVVGASITSLIHGKLIKKDYPHRIISGNVLTGKQVFSDTFLGFFDSLVSVIPEGNEYELLGWATPGANKFSASKTFLSNIVPKKKYKHNANMHGGPRAFVMSGEYERVLPMKILPVYLLKAILAEDIDKMEKLGIYEVIEEDFATCEFVCTSKIKVQDIIRKGIDLMIKELGE